jgi:hypothetical protein
MVGAELRVLERGGATEETEEGGGAGAGAGAEEVITIGDVGDDAGGAGGGVVTTAGGIVDIGVEDETGAAGSPRGECPLVLNSDKARNPPHMILPSPAQGKLHSDSDIWLMTVSLSPQ